MAIPGLSDQRAVNSSASSEEQLEREKKLHAAKLKVADCLQRLVPKSANELSEAIAAYRTRLEVWESGARNVASWEELSAFVDELDAKVFNADALAFVLKIIAEAEPATFPLEQVERHAEAVSGLIDSIPALPPMPEEIISPKVEPVVGHESVPKPALSPYYTHDDASLETDPFTPEGMALLNQVSLRILKAKGGFGSLGEAAHKGLYEAYVPLGFLIKSGFAGNLAEVLLNTYGHEVGAPTVRRIIESISAANAHHELFSMRDGTYQVNVSSVVTNYLAKGFGANAD